MPLKRKGMSLNDLPIQRNLCKVSRFLTLLLEFHLQIASLGAEVPLRRVLIDQIILGRCLSDQVRSEDVTAFFFFSSFKQRHIAHLFFVRALSSFQPAEEQL